MSNHRPPRHFFAPFPKESKELEPVPDIVPHQASKKPRISKPDSDERRYKWLHYKTRLCNNFKWGRCSYGEACLYAHGNEELRSNPFGHNESSTEYVNHRIFGELQLCKMFSNEGKCAYGERCRFRHVVSRSVRGDESVIISTLASKGSQGSGYGKFGTNGVNGGRHFRQQGSVIGGHFANGNAVIRKLCGYSTVETKHVKTCTSSSELQVLDGNFNWNELEKMSRIYADWIEEIPLVHRKVAC